MISYTDRVNFQDNIPWSREEVKVINDKIRAGKSLAIIGVYCAIPVLLFMFWLTKENISQVKTTDYLALLFGALFFLGFAYLIFWLVGKFFVYNLNKDLKNGKCSLSSLLIEKDKTENDEYFFTFVGLRANREIRLSVRVEEYEKYSTGTRLKIEYLQYSKEILNIVN